MAKINQKKCIRCNLCLNEYPNAFKLNNGRININLLFYKRRMAKICPVKAII